MKTKQMYAKIRVALGVCFSIFSNIRPHHHKHRVL